MVNHGRRLTLIRIGYNLCLAIESSSGGTKSWLSYVFALLQDLDLMKTYVLKIQELEGELRRLKSVNSSKRSRFSDCVDSDDDGTSKNSLFSSENGYLSSGILEK